MLLMQQDETSYNGNDLGATYSKDSTTFKVWSPTASEVKVRLYKYGSEKENKDGFFKEQDMTFDKSNGVWSCTLTGDLKNKYYTYVVTNDGKAEEVVDIYAKAVGANGKRGMIVDLSSTNPTDWNKDTHKTVKNQTDAVIWEVQVKDFSYAENSGVSKENRGKFLAFTEDGTVVDGVSGNNATCISYRNLVLTMYRLTLCMTLVQWMKPVRMTSLTGAMTLLTTILLKVHFHQTLMTVMLESMNVSR